MKITLAAITGSTRRARPGAAFALAEEYLARATAYVPCEFEGFETESGLLRAMERRGGRVPAVLLLFDGRGAALSSAEFAAKLGGLREAGRQRVVLAIGPADGWSEGALSAADGAISLGRMTLPHALAQAVAAEQIYRALTILAGHPYHCGH